MREREGGGGEEEEEERERMTMVMPMPMPTCEVHTVAVDPHRRVLALPRRRVGLKIRVEVRCLFFSLFFCLTGVAGVPACHCIALPAIADLNGPIVNWAHHRITSTFQHPKRVRYVEYPTRRAGAQAAG